MERIVLFLKGACMGVADIIPGVSGGTMALILGIYAELVNSIKGLHLRWLPAVWRWIRGGFRREDFQEVVSHWREMNIPFLAILGIGIAVAIAAGGMVLPGLLDRHPEAMRALFFGLIVASIGIPFRMVSFSEPNTKWWVAAMVAVGIGAGWTATAPERIHDAGIHWVEVEAQQGDTLESINRRGPGAWSADRIYWAEQNEPLRRAVQRADDAAVPPDGGAAEAVSDDERQELYGELEIPAGTPVQIPQLAVWYVFVAGIIAICAMILPGISGAYILLILGAYYFVLNALRGVLTGFAEVTLPMGAMTFVVAFCVGALIGILSFARLMSYLLRRFRAVTIGLLVGLMIGCLRGIWPFQEMVDGRMINVVPDAVDATVVAAVVTAVAGAAAVLVLSRVGEGRKTETSR